MTVSIMECHIFQVCRFYLFSLIKMVPDLAQTLNTTLLTFAILEATLVQVTKWTE
jgi:hypothetical protein